MLFHYKKESKNRAEDRFVEVTTGLAQLPEAGGVLDQPVWLMEIFDYFRSGEAAAVEKALK
jgi:hypothetical protein